MRFRNVGSLVVDLVVGGMVTMLAMTFSDPNARGLRLKALETLSPWGIGVRVDGATPAFQ